LSTSTLWTDEQHIWRRGEGTDIITCARLFDDRFMYVDFVMDRKWPVSIDKASRC